MSTKRVSLNISLPDEAFKKEVKRIAKARRKTPSQELVALYQRLARLRATPPRK
jgi:hypothetical protein